MPRGVTPAGRLAGLGFADAETAGQSLGRDLRLDVLGADADLVAALGRAASPDQALAALVRLPLLEPLLPALQSDPALRDRMFAVLGMSAALADHLRRHGADWRLLAGSGADLAP